MIISMAVLGLSEPPGDGSFTDSKGAGSAAMLRLALAAIARIALGGLAMDALRPAALWFALVVVAGCASTEVTQRQRYEGEKLARPGRIIVHDFTGNPADVPAESPFATRLAGAVTPTPEQREVGRRMGVEIAEHLVVDLLNLGLPAVRAVGQRAPEVDDIVLRGYFVSIDEGSATKRVLVGFGSGAAEISVAVEGYQMTAQGLRLLGSGEVASGGSKTPGMVLPLGVLAATANPIGLVIGGGAKLYGEGTGLDRIERAAERTADEISAQLREAAEEQGWIWSRTHSSSATTVR
jgi:hypothetical protein